MGGLGNITTISTQESEYTGSYINLYRNLIKIKIKICRLFYDFNLNTIIKNIKKKTMI